MLARGAALCSMSLVRIAVMAGSSKRSNQSRLGVVHLAASKDNSGDWIALYAENKDSVQKRAFYGTLEVAL